MQIISLCLEYMASYYRCEDFVIYYFLTSERTKLDLDNVWKENSQLLATSSVEQMRNIIK